MEQTVKLWWISVKCMEVFIVTMEIFSKFDIISKWKVTQKKCVSLRYKQKNNNNKRRKF